MQSDNGLQNKQDFSSKTGLYSSEKGLNSAHQAANTQKDAFQIMMCASKSNDGSPELRTKRTSDQLSSPSSPANAIEMKK